MIEEAAKYRFNNITEFMLGAQRRTGAKHLFELGAWYGVVTKRLQDAGADVIAYEAVVDFAQAVRTAAPKVRVFNETICEQSSYKPFFNMVPNDTLNTSGLLTPSSDRTVELAVGPCLTPRAFVERHADVIPESGFQVNIEGFDIELVNAILEAGLKPKFLMLEIRSSLQAAWSATQRLALNRLYGLQLERLTFAPTSMHIGFEPGRTTWWYVNTFQPPVNVYTA